MLDMLESIGVDFRAAMDPIQDNFLALRALDVEDKMGECKIDWYGLLSEDS